MIDFTWKIFAKTGNLETYLLFKEIERDYQETAEKNVNELIETEAP
ncbi:YqzL family protein [Calidifontibacillus erzurumensis]|uniref:YqzL family protein n=1 Tax=Calidifontibacillus erzurumensis TaxID=2741433 RepID=A0A8J8GAF4_9BACI|nr:YqzL family protein [Calidifontibacillus erzurumensis]NSL50295.1 YqzL family protein [Calidifontibacillus erzurumensis]